MTEREKKIFICGTAFGLVVCLVAFLSLKIAYNPIIQDYGYDPLNEREMKWRTMYYQCLNATPYTDGEKVHHYWTVQE